MLNYYLSFWNEWKAVLLDGKLTATNPECEYSLVSAELENKAVFTAYSDRVIPVKTEKTVAVNATAENALIIKNAKGKNYRVVNCMGEEISNGVIGSDLQEIFVNTAGMIFIY
jgi:hypothetical protein